MSLRQGRVRWKVPRRGHPNHREVRHKIGSVLRSRIRDCLLEMPGAVSRADSGVGIETRVIRQALEAVVMMMSELDIGQCVIVFARRDLDVPGI